LNFGFQKQAGRGRGEEQCGDFHNFVLLMVLGCVMVPETGCPPAGRCPRELPPGDRTHWNPLLHYLFQTVQRWLQKTEMGERISAAESASCKVSRLG
jgi:hypothetical protein